MERILVIDDDVGLCELLVEYLTIEGFQVETVNDGQSGAERVSGGNYDLIVLDVMLPGMNGFEVLRHIRGKMSTPVIMLTARGDDVDRIVGLELGADDYLPKPFNPRELVARIRAVLRRVRPEREEAAPPSAPKKLKVGDVEMDIGARVVLRAGEQVDLTTVEFNLLEHLIRNAGELVSREKLIKIVLGRSLSAYDRSIDVHISKLRKKLGREVDGMERIKSIRSVGYLYALVSPADNLGNQ
ncbi:MAG: response regulator transcription factor [Deltaproteobacteria bacterium]|nr:response regulator transcription factor [Deltaproteobacteria bacterium]